MKKQTIESDLLAVKAMQVLLNDAANGLQEIIDRYEKYKQSDEYKHNKEIYGEKCKDWFREKDVYIPCYGMAKKGYPTRIKENMKMLRRLALDIYKDF